MTKEKKNGNKKAFWSISVTVVLTILLCFYFVSIFKNNCKQVSDLNTYRRQYMESRHE